MSSITVDDDNYWHPINYSINNKDKNNETKTESVIDRHSEKHNIQNKLMISKSIKLKELKLIPQPLPALHHHNFDIFTTSNPNFSDLKDLESQYQYLESLAIKVVENICIVIKHSWKYNKELHGEYAQQFLVLFKSIFSNIKPISCSPQIKSVLVKIYDDLYFNKFIQNQINDLFLGLDNSNLRLLILGFLIEEYHYILPEFEFVLGICSLGLELLRIKLFEDHHKRIVNYDYYSNYNLNLKDKFKNKDWKQPIKIVRFTKITNTNK
ncbi:hypothetical protein KGF54_004394 [Candida jiufengensis]|uniref:uncharacterized protein n=1 Tax=Candida jiufengensis TaxID=497108 RepID=UPI002225B49F|nr:uncharacterized protein KGF54_004394 [Candida jiufengensis]KAI5951320.1 hypothetical protein KGF54_004394 [Candida jiufengensis]